MIEIRKKYNIFSRPSLGLTTYYFIDMDSHDGTRYRSICVDSYGTSFKATHNYVVHESILRMVSYEPATWLEVLIKFGLTPSKIKKWFATTQRGVTCEPC